MTNKIVRGEGGRFAPGTSGGPGKPKSQFTVSDYEKVLRDNITPDEFWEMTKPVIEHIKKTGSVRAWVAVTDRLMGKAAVVAPTAAGNNLDGLLAALAEVRQQRMEWEAREGAESSATIIDMTPVSQ